MMADYCFKANKPKLDHYGISMGKAGVLIKVGARLTPRRTWDSNPTHGPRPLKNRLIPHNGQVRKTAIGTNSPAGLTHHLSLLLPAFPVSVSRPLGVGALPFQTGPRSLQTYPNTYDLMVCQPIGVVTKVGGTSGRNLNPMQKQMAGMTSSPVGSSSG